MSFMMLSSFYSISKLVKISLENSYRVQIKLGCGITD